MYVFRFFCGLSDSLFSVRALCSVQVLYRQAGHPAMDLSCRIPVSAVPVEIYGFHSQQINRHVIDTVHLFPENEMIAQCLDPVVSL